jgi:hypothetical protein
MAEGTDSRPRSRSEIRRVELAVGASLEHIRRLRCRPAQQRREVVTLDSAERTDAGNTAGTTSISPVTSPRAERSSGWSAHGRQVGQ